MVREADFLLPQAPVCYVPKKVEGETDVSGKFVGDCFVLHKKCDCIRERLSY